MKLFNKLKRFRRPFRIIMGLTLVALGLITSNGWFFLGIIPLLVGITNFCPVCALTKKCSI